MVLDTFRAIRPVSCRTSNSRSLTIPYHTIPYPDSPARSLSRRNGTLLGCLVANAEINKNLEETRGRRSTGKRQRVRMVDESSGRGQEKKSLFTRLSIGAGMSKGWVCNIDSASFKHHPFGTDSLHLFIPHVLCLVYISFPISKPDPHQKLIR